jgi:hypothetical protein
MEGVPAPENGLGSVIGVVMEKWPASSHLVDEGFDPHSFARMFVIFPPYGQGDPVPFGTTMDVGQIHKARDFSGRGGLSCRGYDRGGTRC